jgi:hypothetical protein
MADLASACSDRCRLLQSSGSFEVTEDQSGYVLAHPVYLDVAMMISFLAYLEGGVVTQEEETQKEGGARERALKGRAGLRARLPWALDAEAGSEGSTQRRDEVSLESKSARQHTAASLFNLLYEYLTTDNQLVDLRDPEQIQGLRPGQLVELAGEYLGNPLEDILAFVAAMYPYFAEQQKVQKAAAAEALQQARKAQRSGNPARRPQAQGSTPDVTAIMADVMEKLQNSENEFGIQMMLRMADDITKVPVHDLLLRTPTGLHAVLTVSSEYYSATTNEYLRAGKFRVVGKVTKIVIDADTINLTRRTFLGAAKSELVEELVTNVKSGELKLDVADPIVASPAVQVLPMAIFI